MFAYRASLCILGLLSVVPCIAQMQKLALQPRWSIPFAMGESVRFVHERDAIYVAERDRVTCLEKATGAVRWQAKLSREVDKRYARAAAVCLTPQAVCVAYHEPDVVLDILDRKTGKLRATVVYRWRKFNGIVPDQRYVIVCTTEHNYPDRVHLSTVDVATGMRIEGITPYVGHSLWRPYYAFGGQVFSAGRQGDRINLFRLPIYQREFGDHVAPRHVWILPGGRALVSTYDPLFYNGVGAELSLWCLEPFNRLWAIGLPDFEAGARDWVAFTKDVYLVGKETWLSTSSQVFLLKDWPVRVPGFTQVFESRGILFGVKRHRRAGVRHEELFRYAGKGTFRPYAVLSMTRADSTPLYPMGESLLRHSYSGSGDARTHRLELFRILDAPSPTPE